jgi:phosphate transport system protein
MVDHTVKAYDKELDALARRIVEMGGIAEKMVVDAMDALANADASLAQQVVATDPRLDALQREIEEQAVLTIARRQPVADDLREIVGAIRAAGDLERVGPRQKHRQAFDQDRSECPGATSNGRPQAHERGGDGITEGRS